MKQFDYFAPTEIFFGVGRIAEIGEITAQYGKKALLVTGSGRSERSELYDRVGKYLNEAGVSCVHYAEVTPNPTTDIVTEGAGIAVSEGVDVVVGLGGGSAIDTAKAVAVEAVHSGTAWDYNCHTCGPTKKTLPIIAVGTTAGTGSQTTPCAVITKTSECDKSAIWHRNIFPRAAVIDPELTLSMPKQVTAQTGFDAFCHNFEAYLSKNTNVFVECMALEAMRIIVEYLPKVLQDGDDLEARSQMAWADTLGGLTNASAGVTLPHGLGMQIGGHCPHVTHGQSLAVFYPAFTRYTCTSAEHKFAVVGRIFDSSLDKEPDESAAWKCCESIDAFLKKIGLWVDFRGLNVTKEDIRAIADCGQVLGDYANNPRVATIPEMYDLLLSCYERE